MKLTPEEKRELAKSLVSEADVEEKPEDRRTADEFDNPFNTRLPTYLGKVSYNTVDLRSNRVSGRAII